MPVDILMATYNGEKYLRNQILSLLQQTYQEWTLYIRDDGSSDRTLEIIGDFARQDPRIRFVESSPPLGAARNFMKLLDCGSSPYIIFCDQDDIWLERKIELMVRFADENFAPDKPALVYCNCYAYLDKEGFVVERPLASPPAEHLRDYLFINGGYQGSSTLFNRCLLLKARQYAGYVYMHDDIISLVAHVFGKVHFLPKPLMLYRQHENNVTGNIRFGLDKLKKTLFSSEEPVLRRMHFEEKKSFYEFHKPELSTEQRTLFEEYIRFPHVSSLQRVSLLLKNRFSLGGNMLSLVAKTMIRKAIA